MWEVIPGILEKEWGSIEKKIELVKPFVKTIHIDIIDGKFAPNITFLDPTPFKKYSREVFFEVQMMVDNPLKYIESYAKAGFKRFIGQIEKMPDQKAFIDFAKKFGEAGLAIDEPSSIDEIKVDFNYPDCFLLMSVKAGFSGQTFMPDVLKKIETLRKKTENLIEIDGGVNKDIIGGLKLLRVNRCVITSALFNSSDPESEYHNLQNLTF